MYTESLDSLYEEEKSKYNEKEKANKPIGVDRKILERIKIKENVKRETFGSTPIFVDEHIAFCCEGETSTVTEIEKKTIFRETHKQQ